MKFKKVVSLFAAAAMAVSSFAGLGISASAADGDLLNVAAVINNGTGTLITSAEQVQGTAVSFGVDATGARVDAGAEASVMDISGKYHSEHGLTNFVATVTVSGPTMITAGTCNWGGDLVVKDASSTEVARISTNNGTCYHNNTTNNVVSAYYKGDATTLTISGGGYVPYVAVAEVDVSEIPNDATLTFDIGSTGAEGIAPESQKVDIGTELTIPKNTSLYVEGKTLTGWTDGTTTYAIGDNVTVSENITLTPVFTENTVALGDAAASVNFTLRRDSGAITYSSQGGTTIIVGQASINGTSIDVKMDVDTTSGKLANANWTDWAQVNNGTIFTAPVLAGSTVTVDATFNAATYTIDGTSYSQNANTAGSAITIAEDGTVTIVAGDGSYWKGFTITYPKVESGDTEVTPEPTAEPAEDRYSATWQFAKSAGAPEFNSEGKNVDAEYTINVDGTARTLIYNTAKGKLNNVKREDDVQCNAGTVIKLPAYPGMKVSWNTNNYSGFSVDGISYSTSYIYTGNDDQLILTSLGTWLRYVAVEPVTVYTISGTMTGAQTLESGTLTFTGKSTGFVYTTTVNNGTYSIVLPADTYSIVLSDCAYIAETTSYTVNADNSAANIACLPASEQTVSGTIVNAPSEAFTLTFTGAGNTYTLDMAAGATSYTTKLLSDTYTVTSSTGTLSPISSESFLVTNADVTKNLYYPETIPTATSSTVTVYPEVAVSGTNYHTIADAVAGIKAAGYSESTIVLKSGATYQEQVRIQINGVTLKTDGEEKATITWYYGIGYTYYSLGADGYYDKDRAMTKIGKLERDPDRWGAVVRVQGNNFTAENIIFENSFNQRFTEAEAADGVVYNGVQAITVDRVNPTVAADSKAATERAAAIAIEGKGAELYNCEFISSQDTFFTGGTAYVKDCAITGNTDYIFGGGSILFDNCDLIWGGYSDQAVGGYITASNGSDAGYIFRNCTIKDGNRQKAKGAFGRDWGGVNSHAYFINCTDATEKGVSGWSNMGGAVEAGTADLHVFDLEDPASYASYGKSDKYNITKFTFADAKAKYEGAFGIIGFVPAYGANAVTTLTAFDGEADTDDYVYGVVTTITAGESAGVTGITWTVKDADNEVYTFSTSDSVDGGSVLSKGTFPTISGGGEATVSMLFHAPQGTYEVASIAE